MHATKPEMAKKWEKEKKDEAAKRDYKDEYEKFQSSDKSKKYRAELNQYNRDKGTYGNGDGKDASHKGGKIVGFEKESKNRGRAEKSRLKKENNMPDFNPIIDEMLDEVFGEYQMNENSKVIKSIENLATKNKYGDVTGTKMNGKTANLIMKIYNHPKMKRLQKAMDNYTSDELVDMTIGKIPKLLGLKENVTEGSCGYGIDGKIGEEPAGPHLMQKKKKDEGIGDYFSKKISKHGGTRNKAEIENIAKYLMKKGDNKKDALDKIKQNYDYVSKKYRSASVSKKADILTSLQESVNEAKYKGYDWKKQNRKDGHPLIVPALQKTFVNMKDLKKYIDKHGTMESVKEAKDPDVIAQIRGVLKKGYSAVKDPVSGKKMKMDTYTASAITQVYDAINTSNKKKFSKLSILKMQNVAFKVIKK